MLILLLVATLLLVSIVEAGSWSPPSYVTEPNFCGAAISLPGLSISGDGSKIAFETFVNNASDIFVINSDGSGLKQLTNDFEGDGPGEGPPSISGDGTKIAFEKFIYGSDSDEPVACEIFVVNSDGSELKQLTNNSEGSCKVPSQEPSIGGDGSKIAFKRVDFNTWDRGIFVINSDGTGEKQLTNSTHFDEQPSINYDGSKIVFLGGDDFDHQIFVINSDGTGLTQLTDDSERSFMFPSISDNGEKIAFWRAFWRHPESEVDFEYEVGISLVSYLSDVDDKNGVPQDESFLNLPLIIALAATIGVLGFTFIVHNRRRQGT